MNDKTQELLNQLEDQIREEEALSFVGSDRYLEDLRVAVAEVVRNTHAYLYPLDDDPETPRGIGVHIVAPLDEDGSAFALDEAVVPFEGLIDQAKRDLDSEDYECMLDELEEILRKHGRVAQ